MGDPEAIRSKLDCFMSGLRKRNPGEIEFHQAVQEVAETLMPYILEHPEYEKAPDPRAHDRAGSDCDISRQLGGRQGACSHQPGLARAVQQLDRSLQGGHAILGREPLVFARAAGRRWPGSRRL